MAKKCNFKSNLSNSFLWFVYIPLYVLCCKSIASQGNYIQRYNPMVTDSTYLGPPLKLSYESRKIINMQNTNSNVVISKNIETILVGLNTFLLKILCFKIFFQGVTKDTSYSFENLVRIVHPLKLSVLHLESCLQQKTCT